MARNTSERPNEVDTDADRYPTVKQGLRKLLEADDLDDTILDRLDVRFLANGEVTCRTWEPRAEEFRVVFIPAPV